MISVEEAKELLAKPEMEALSELGEELQSFSIAPLSKKELIAIANKWLGEQQDSLRKRICGHPVVREVVEKDRYTEDISLLIAIITVIRPDYTMPVASLVALWVVRRGLVSFCGS